MCNVVTVAALLNLLRTILPLLKDKVRVVVEIACLHEACKLCYKGPHISPVLMRLILNLAYHIEDPDRFGDTLNIFLLPYISISAVF